MAYNRNVCKTFNLTTTGAGNKLCLADQECSEVIVVSTVATNFYDYRNPTVLFQVPANAIFTFRGLTNSNQLTAAGANGTLYYRTQFFSFLPGY